MALVNRKTGKYIKVIRDQTIFSLNSVQVFYYEFKTQKDRDAYFKRLDEIKEFEETVNQKVDELIVDYNKRYDENIKNNEFIGDKNSFIKEMRYIEGVSSELDIIRFGWSSNKKLPELKNRELFESLGYKKEWDTPLNSWGINSVHTGAFNGQTFSFESLYKELKKVFKHDYVDI